MGKVLFCHGGTKFPPRWNRMFSTMERIRAEVADPALFYDHDTERRMILGEAIGLRAYMHFDLLRMYAPAPAANPNTRTFIPYVDKYPSYVNDKQTVSYCLEHAIADLKESQRILFDIDTEWMFGNNRVESLSGQDWCIVKSDSLYMGIAAEETAYSYNEGHVLLSQKLGKNKKDHTATWCPRPCLLSGEVMTMGTGSLSSTRPHHTLSKGNTRDTRWTAQWKP